MTSPLLTTGLLLLLGVVWGLGGSDFIGHHKSGKTRKSTPLIPLPQSRERKPNIILILTDDQDVELGKYIKKSIRIYENSCNHV